MNKRILVSAVCAWLVCFSAEACWYCSFKAKDYLTYRVLPAETQAEEEDDDIASNCRLWQKQSNQEIPIDDIRQVVYKWSFKRLKSLTPKNCGGNKFAEWIARNKEAADFLVLAKRIELLREKANDPWNYPHQGDELSTKLRAACDEAKAGLGGKLHDRYLLQTIRALKTLRQDEEIIRLWNSERIGEPLIRKMIARYVAGAYYACKKYDKALKMFSYCGDAVSVKWCLREMGSQTDVLAVIDQLACNPENYSQVAADLQQFISDLEISVENNIDCEAEIDRVIALAHKHAKEAPVKQKALWHYTEAFGHWLENDLDGANKAIRKAEAVASGKELSQSVHVLRLLIESRILPADKNYDAWLYEASRWLIEQAEKEEIVKPENYPWIEEPSDRAMLYYTDFKDQYSTVCFHRNINQSQFYYADMLRKMVIGYAAPKLMEAGDTIRALQTTDMADHVLLPAKIIKQMSRHDNATFAMADTLRANIVVKFVERIIKPKDKYDAFYSKHGSGCNRSYWCDLAGTLLLRETRYEEAIPWLKEVSRAFRSHMEVLPYFDTNPFALELISDAKCTQKEVRQPIRTDYKLWFAQKMVSLKRGYQKERDANKRARMQLLFATGMRNSVYPCWPLTQYYWGDVIFGSADGIGELTEFSIAEFLHDDYWPYQSVNRHEGQFRKIRRQSTKLMDEALATFTDKEQLASVHWSMGNYKTVWRHYSDTRFASKKSGQCDRWKDYAWR